MALLPQYLTIFLQLLAGSVIIIIIIPERRLNFVCYDACLL